MRAVLTAAIALMASPAIAADQFDLVCSAPKTSVRYRIDLERGEYCADECNLIQKIQQVTAGMLTLKRHDPMFRSDRTSFTTIDRTTGAWRWFFSSPGESKAQDVRGLCEPASFSGFPAAKF